ncbi:MAG TPA: GNAT family N-acetyltransferase [Steroidobacteraceae bacterium]|nr:GNAT family N-acetyltransferase [Steroidobacteraceae bacterium]
MTQVRPLRSADRPQWADLWQGYLHFYRRHLPEQLTETTFARLIDPSRQPHGLVAEHEGRLIGLVHYLFHTSSWSMTDVCYLEDLYVDPAARGAGAGRALIEAVYAAADRASVDTVYWLTQEFNADGRALYDTLAHRTSFIRYER